MADNDLAEIECWLQSHFRGSGDSSRLLCVLKEVLSRLERKERQRLYEPGTHMLYPGVSMAGKLSAPACWWVVFRSDAQKQERKALMGEVVHELGHVVLRHEEGYPRDKAECELDRWAVLMRFKKETVARYLVMLENGPDGRGPPEEGTRRKWMERLAKVEAMQEPADDGQCR